MEATMIEAGAEKSVGSLFRWSGWLHVGDGAQDCEERFTGRCEDEEHFHAWCRLPNPFQQRDIAEKARAAKARKTLAMKDGASDSHVILEAQLDEIRVADDRDGLVAEIIDRDWGRDMERALERVEDDERFQHHDQNREEYLRLRALDPEQRNPEEWEHLDALMQEYGACAEEELAKIQGPRREQLQGKSTEELIEVCRRDRIENAGNEAYLHVYNTWQWYIGTLAPRCDKTGKPLRPKDRVFSSVSELQFDAPPEVVTAIQDKFVELEQAQAKGRAAKN